MMSRMRTFLAFCLLGAGCASAPSANVAQWEGADSDVPAAGYVVIREAEAWRSLWEKIGRPAPRVDLDSRFVVAVFLGDKRPGEYHLSWRYDTAADRKTLTVSYTAYRRDDEDAPDGGPRRRPYAVWSFPRDMAAPDADIRVVDATPGGAGAL